MGKTIAQLDLWLSSGCHTETAAEEVTGAWATCKLIAAADLEPGTGIKGPSCPTTSHLFCSLCTLISAPKWFLWGEQTGYKEESQMEKEWRGHSGLCTTSFLSCRHFSDLSCGAPQDEAEEIARKRQALCLYSSMPSILNPQQASCAMTLRPLLNSHTFAKCFS